MNYKILGVNGDKDFCSCCGKQNLKKVVWIENTESGEFDHYGTTCASYLLSNKKGGKVKIDALLINAAHYFENNIIALLPWVGERREREDQIAEALLLAGYDKMFFTVAIYTAGFCNYIWPYQRRLKNSQQ